MYEEGLVLEKRFGLSLKAGSGVKTSPRGKNKWMVGEGSFSGRNSQEWENKGSDGRAQGDKEDTVVSGSGSTKEVVLKHTEESSGEQKRIHIWEAGTSQEQGGRDGTGCLDGTKNGEETGLER
ncbi:unnamed protein product [Cuscuta epithymum]|uniref:Uncharacterized protein n=1 Tax=Cuscuta epithymum TaxID=186058 RepID=A0AAV0CT35_9ASTE|nr:unnamed protein product [Cuscuta epithymum]